ncbi:hypothetical protein MMPV_000438 [Pyropia vietnamensis]
MRLFFSRPPRPQVHGKDGGSPPSPPLSSPSTSPAAAPAVTPLGHSSAKGPALERTTSSLSPSPSPPRALPPLLLLAAARAPTREHPPLWLLAVARSVGSPSRRALAWLRRRLPPPPQGRPRLLGRPSGVVATAAPAELVEEGHGRGGRRSHHGDSDGGGSDGGGSFAGEARGFRLHGWRWHHVAIRRELGAIASALGSGVDCGDPSAVAAVVDAFAFARRSVWAVHNTMEREVLFPWIDTGVCVAATDGGQGTPTVTAVSRRADGGGGGRGGGSGIGVAGRSPARQRAVSAALSSFAAERERLEVAATEVEARLARLSAATADRDAPWRGIAACGPETARAAAAVRVLADEAAALFAAEESALIPLVTCDFSADEQARVFLTAVHRLAGGLRGSTAKLQLVLFHEALKAGGGGEEWGHFKREVPRPARAWIPVWKKRLYDGCPTTVLAERARERRRTGGGGVAGRR